MSVTVVLNEPQDIVNIALVIRAMRNFGLKNLRLVQPAEFDAYRIEGIAHNTGDVIARVVVYPSLDAGMADATFAVAFTARERTVKRNALDLRDAAADIVARSRNGETVVMLFGREDRGLSNADLDRCHRSVTIPTAPEHTSLNLGQAFCVAAYEVFMADGAVRPRPPAGRVVSPARHEELESLFASAYDALEAIDFFKARNPDVPMRALRELVHRTPIDRQEARMLQAMSVEVLRFLERSGVRP
ncbi:MAG TPA: TrmH family RNA methyltransferase [Gemmatimonadales bacterium]